MSDLKKQLAEAKSLGKMFRGMQAVITAMENVVSLEDAAKDAKAASKSAEKETKEIAAELNKEKEAHKTAMLAMKEEKAKAKLDYTNAMAIHADKIKGAKDEAALIIQQAEATKRQLMDEIRQENVDAENTITELNEAITEREAKLSELEASIAKIKSKFNS